MNSYFIYKDVRIRFTYLIAWMIKQYLERQPILLWALQIVMRTARNNFVKCQRWGTEYLKDEHLGLLIIIIYVHPNDVSASVY